MKTTFIYQVPPCYFVFYRHYRNQTSGRPPSVVHTHASILGRLTKIKYTTEVRFKIRGRISLLFGGGWYSEVVLLFLFDVGKTAGCWFFAFGCIPARRQKTPFWQGSEKIASRLPTRKARPLLYVKYPPGTLISIIFIEIGHREGSHRTFFAKLAAYRF